MILPHFLLIHSLKPEIDDLMKYLTAFLSLLMISFQVLSQPKPVVQGRVSDAEGHPVSSATVRVLNSPLGAITDGNGRFNIQQLTTGPKKISVTAVGFASALIETDVIAGLNPDIDIRLRKTELALDEVVVSSDRKEEDILRVPVSVSSLDGRSIASFRLWDLGELSALSPSLYTSDPGDGRQATSLRGITTTSYDPAVLTVIDGVSQFNLDTYIPQLMDVEKIEILRGPQGTLYGRNAMGGVIKVTTRRPGAGDRTRWEISSGNFGQQRLMVGTRSTLKKDKLYLGVALMNERRKGFFQNEATGSDYDGQRRFTGNYHLRFLPNATWEWSLNLKHSFARNNGAFPLAPDMDAAMKDPYILSQNATGQMQDRTMNASMSVQRHGRQAKMELLTSFQRNHRIYDRPIDGDFSAYDIVTIDNNYGNAYNRVSVLTQELRFSSVDRSGDRLQWTAGLFGFVQDNPVKQATRFGKDAGFMGIPDKNFALISTNLGKGEGIAGYGQATWSITPTLLLTGGLRYDREWKRMSVEGAYEKTGGPTFITRPDTSGQGSYAAFSPKAGLQYLIGEKTSAHLTYSRGFRAGGLSTLGSDPSQPPLIGYDPESSDHWEIGWKGAFAQNRIRTYIALFHSRIGNAQVPTLILPDAITITRNAGSIRSRGVEVETEWRPARGLSFSWRYARTNADYTRLRLSKNGQEENLDGNRQIMTPAHTSMLTGDYGIPLGRKKRLSLDLRAEWKHTGTVYFDLSNDIQQTPYGLVNLRAGIKGEKYALHGWVRNLTGEKFVDYAYDFGAVHLGDPRTYGFTLTRQ
jgi:iron complex outermembrane recepter protein